MIELSGVVITFNEEKKIGRCLDSLLKVCEDVVVVDSFSTDRTKEICLEKGARFIENKFEGHIEQKNFAITQAKYSYVLSLDADEELDDELIESIKWIKKHFSKDGYAMKRRNNYCGKWIRFGSWYPDIKLRLWESMMGKWVGENPHDRFELKEEGTQAMLDGHILHYTIDTVEDHKKQVEKFSDIAARELKKKGKRLPGLFIVVRSSFKFITDYFFRFGFLDGKYGFIIARLNARYVYLKYTKAKKANP